MLTIVLVMRTTLQYVVYTADFLLISTVSRYYIPVTAAIIIQH